ncbi:hypothetical protein ACOMHN_009493 [Nucella lapillus]
MQHITSQRNTTQDNTVQYITTQHITTQHITTQHITSQRNTTQETLAWWSSGVDSKVTVESKAGSAETSATGAGKLAWRFGCYCCCFPSCTGLSDAVTSIVLKCLCCFECHGTPSSSILGALLKLPGGYSGVALKQSEAF